MQLENSFTVPVPIQQAWDLLLDPGRVAKCIPGATLESVAGDEMRGRVKVKLGPMSMLYKGTARFIERDNANYSVVMEAFGKDSGGGGGVKAQMRMALAEEGGGTRCTVDTDLNITGKPAQFGRGVMADVSSKLIDEFANRLAREVHREDSQGPGHGGSPDGDTDGDDALDLLGTLGWQAIARAAAPVVILGLIVFLVVRAKKRKKS